MEPGSGFCILFLNAKQLAFFKDIVSYIAHCGRIMVNDTQTDRLSCMPKNYNLEIVLHPVDEE